MFAVQNFVGVVPCRCEAIGNQSFCCRLADATLCPDV